MKPIHELRTFLASLLPPLRARRQYADVLNVEVAQEIAADVVAQTNQHAGLAYAAEQADLEAVKLIGVIKADGHLTDDELPLLERALRHINRSAENDRRLSTELPA